jgi:predicted nucleic acid-binding protein
MGRPDVKAGGRYYLDANTVIAIVEGVDDLHPAQRTFLRSIDEGAVLAVSSEMTLSECLVRPFRERDGAAIAIMLDFLNGRRTLPLVPLSRDVMIMAAKIRAETTAKLPDAIHLACALDAGCTVFISADKRLPMIGDLRRASFDDVGPFEEPSP